MSKYRKITVKNYNFNWVYSSHGAYIRAADSDNPYRGPYKAECGRQRNKHNWEVKPSDVAKWITENIFNEKYIESIASNKEESNIKNETKLLISEAYALVRRNWYTIEQYYHEYNDEIIFVSDDPSIIIKLKNDYDKDNDKKDWIYEGEGEVSKVEYLKQVIKKIA